MDRTTGTKDTGGFGCLAIVIVAAGYGAITSAAAHIIAAISGIVIATIVTRALARGFASGLTIASKRRPLPRLKMRRQG